MQRLFHHTRHTLQFIAQPPVLILAGLAMLVIAFTFPGLPACTGMALVALGATAVTAERFQTSPARSPTLFSHLLIYTALYLLFVGATLDGATRVGASLSQLARLDLVFSLTLMASAAKIVLLVIVRPLRAEY